MWSHRRTAAPALGCRRHGCGCRARLPRQKGLGRGESVPCSVLMEDQRIPSHVPVAIHVGAPVGKAETAQAESLDASRVTKRGQQRRHACCAPRRPPPPAQRECVNNPMGCSCSPLARVLGAQAPQKGPLPFTFLCFTGQSTGPHKGGACSPPTVSSMRRACGAPISAEDGTGGGRNVSHRHGATLDASIERLRMLVLVCGVPVRAES